jgi:hypothetical protein
LSNETAAAQVTTGNTAGTPLDSIQYVSDPSTAIWRVQTSFNYEWTYNPATHGNKTLNGIPSGVVQPQFLAAISTPTLVEGIPYSYAGSRGKDVEYQTQYDTTFPQAVSLGKYTGNCTSSVSTQKTCGVDCSGYVSVCYLLGAKYSTYSLCGSGKPFYWISGDPQSGDIMNHPGDHVFILYYNFVLYGRMLYCIYECTTTAHYRTGNWNHIDKTCYGAFYVDNADLTGYAFARLNGW